MAIRPEIVDRVIEIRVDRLDKNLEDLLKDYEKASSTEVASESVFSCLEKISIARLETSFMKSILKYIKHIQNGMDALKSKLQDMYYKNSQLKMKLYHYSMKSKTLQQTVTDLKKENEVLQKLVLSIHQEKKKNIRENDTTYLSHSNNKVIQNDYPEDEFWGKDEADGIINQLAKNVNIFRNLTSIQDEV
ncbi:uncharacterized protein LOC106657474 [Trichogramma pretiosum]|uniref:uncharacterized protein LOC106657474 n=1 Tax=Trichogramma pretiosum TaxID=7493 RepID=UPI0006C97539|nr:uncharacterized protein LOC106657474 [Trichogramma pretiosum]